MAKAILEFDLNEPDDIQEHRRVIKSLDLALAIWDIVHNTKKGLEWSLDEKEVDKYETLEMVYDRIHEILNQYHIDIDDLIS